MVSLPNNRIEFEDTHPTERPTLSKAPGDWAALMDSEQMLQMIDKILPFEVCLYYQVLPMSMEGSRLNLGMVNPEDNSALDYVRRILSYINYSLVPRLIPSEAHQAMLSAYLNYVGKQRQAIVDKGVAAKQKVVQSEPVPVKVESTDRANSSANSHGNNGGAIGARRSTIASPASPERPTPNHAAKSSPPLHSDRATLILEDPEEPDFADLERIIDSESPAPPPPPSDPPSLSRKPQAQPAYLELEEEDDEGETAFFHLGTVTSSSELPRQDTHSARVGKPPSKAPAPRSVSEHDHSETLALPDEMSPPPQSLPTIGIPSLPVLQVQSIHLSSPIEVLATLPPKNLVQELLARVLVGGIGRLFFERQQHQGKVLWSQNGVLQSALEGLAPDAFQSVINELKLLTDLPLISVQKPRQVEIERIYQHTRLLLRFRVTPGNYGEEATLQVLRGAALKFYQQQQLATLERDALGIAQQLQRKLGEIRDRAQFDPAMADAQLDSLTALNQMLKTMDQQIRDLETFKSDQK